EVSLILKTKNEKLQQNNTNVNPEQVEIIAKQVLSFLSQNKLLLKEATLAEVVDYVVASTNNTNQADEYDYLDFSEVKALENLLNQKTANSFPLLNQQQVELNMALGQIAGLETQIEQMKAQLT